MLSKQQADRIASAVRDAEAHTSSEIAVGIVPSSGDDRGIAAVVGALVAGILVFWLCDRFDLGLRCLPARLLVKDARRVARAIFLDHGLDNTPERNAVLLFVSRAEHYVEILPDRAAAAAIELAHWSAIVDGFRQAARKGDLGEAVAGAVAAIGVVCAVHFPASGANPDRVSNQAIQG